MHHFQSTHTELQAVPGTLDTNLPGEAVDAETSLHLIKPNWRAWSQVKKHHSSGAIKSLCKAGGDKLHGMLQQGMAAAYQQTEGVAAKMKQEEEGANEKNIEAAQRKKAASPISYFQLYHNVKE